MIYTLPPLPYAADALEPRMSQETIEYHYGKHLQTYIDNLNRLIAGTPYEKMPLEKIIITAGGPLYNNAAQVWNHTFFFNSLTPEPELIPLELADYFIRDFGSVENFKEKFKKAAVEVFGSGWAWLAQDKDGRLHIIQESNAGNPLRAGYKPLLTIDVWEHAYYIDYRNRRVAFVDSCWDLISWKKVLKRMHEPSPAAKVADLAEGTSEAAGASRSGKAEAGGAGAAGAVVVAVAETDREGLTETIAEAVIEDEEAAQCYICVICGWVYDPAEGDPESGIAPGTPFKDIPEDWVCPACGVGKKDFDPWNG